MDSEMHVKRTLRNVLRGFFCVPILIGLFIVTVYPSIAHGAIEHEEKFSLKNIPSLYEIGVAATDEAEILVGEFLDWTIETAADWHTTIDLSKVDVTPEVSLASVALGTQARVSAGSTFLEHVFGEASVEMREEAADRAHAVKTATEISLGFAERAVKGRYGEVVFGKEHLLASIPPAGNAFMSSLCRYISFFCQEGT